MLVSNVLENAANWEMLDKLPPKHVELFQLLNWKPFSEIIYDEHQPIMQPKEEEEEEVKAIEAIFYETLIQDTQHGFASIDAWFASHRGYRHKTRIYTFKLKFPQEN